MTYDNVYFGGMDLSNKSHETVLTILGDYIYTNFSNLDLTSLGDASSDDIASEYIDTPVYIEPINTPIIEIKKHTEHNIIIGNFYKNFVKNKIIEYDSFKDIYFKNNKLDKEYYTKYLELLNIIFIMPFYTLVDNEILYFIENIYHSDDATILNVISKSLILNNTKNKALYHLFITYKVFIEKLIDIFIVLRNDFILFHLSHSKKDNSENQEITAKLNNYPNMIKIWNILDNKNKISTSSPVLFFNFTPPDYELETSIPQIKWLISDEYTTGKSSKKKKDTQKTNRKDTQKTNRKDTQKTNRKDTQKTNRKDTQKTKHQTKQKLQKINSLIQHFLDQIKITKFTYLGFCPKAIKLRFDSILTFPIDELILCITYLYTDLNPNMPALDLEKKCKKIIDEINNIKIDTLHKIEEPTFQKQKIKKINKFKSSDSTEYKVKLFEKYISAFIKLYVDSVSYISANESHINEISLCINQVSKMINTIL